MGCERLDGFAHELHARRRLRLQETACEDIIFTSARSSSTSPPAPMALLPDPTAPSTGSTVRVRKGNYGMGAFYKSIDTLLWGSKTCDIALGFQKKGVTGSAFDIRVCAARTCVGDDAQRLRHSQHFLAVCVPRPISESDPSRVYGMVELRSRSAYAGVR